MLRIVLSTLAIGALLAFCVPLTDAAEEAPPAEVLPLVSAGTHLIWWQSADLNGDGRGDYLLVSEADQSPENDDENFAGDRVLLILIRDLDGVLHAARRNDSLVACRICGGMMGDPFMGTEVGRRGFTVENAGGSSWRWADRYEFRYSRRSQDWFLQRYTHFESHVVDPWYESEEVYRRGRDFGTIAFSDFKEESLEDARKIRKAVHPHVFPDYRYARSLVPAGDDEKDRPTSALEGLRRRMPLSEIYVLLGTPHAQRCEDESCPVWFFDSGMWLTVKDPGVDSFVRVKPRRCKSQPCRRDHPPDY